MLTNIRRFAATASGGFISAPLNSNRGFAVKAARSKQYNQQVQAFDGINIAGGGGGGFSAGYSSTGKQAFVGMLDGFLPAEQKVRNRIFRDIYKHDPVAGGAVDIYATMPFSDFYLTGLKDRDALDVYHRSVEKMRMKIMLPAISRDYLIYGRFIGTTVFDTRENMFSAIVPQDSDNAIIHEVPIYGMDPLIDLTLPDKLIKLLNNKKDPRILNIYNELPEEIKAGLKTGIIPLEPSNTLFIPRRTDTGDSIGTSFFERILPLHLMEKSMFRGTLDQVQRRQRAIMHITVTGDGDDFVPTMENLEEVRNMFAEADADPTGAIIVTHSGVMPNEVRDAQSFFRVDELSDFFTSSKYKALGISEAMITGEANFNAMDATLSLFIENIREYRAMLTREVFYEKIFPAIAVANDFTKEHYTVTGAAHGFGHNSRSYIQDDGNANPYAVCADTRHGFNVRDYVVDTSQLAMPTVSWVKHLRPEGDTQYLQLLTEAQQNGVPVPLAMFASACGLDINGIINNADQEVSLRKRVNQYNEKIAEYVQQNPNGDQYAPQAALAALNAGSRIKPKNWLTRDYPEELQPNERRKNGTVKNTSAKRRKQLYEKQFGVLGEVLKNRAEMKRAKARAERKPR